jgi:hypothetical protein
MTDTPFIEPGAQILSGGRKFTAVAVEPYTRRNGTPSQIVTWCGHCATCSAPYETKGSRAGHNLAINCEEHRGKRTGRRRQASELKWARRVISQAIAALSVGQAEQAADALTSHQKIWERR